MKWKQFEELGFGLSEEEASEHVRVEKFLDELPDELIETFIWPRLLVLPPRDEAGVLLRTLTQEEQKGHIRQMCILRRVCRGWWQWIGRHEDWIYGVCNYIVMYKEYCNRCTNSDDEYYDSDREPSCWKGEY
jgi:hypothetical protein